MHAQQAVQVEDHPFLAFAFVIEIGDQQVMRERGRQDVANRLRSGRARRWLSSISIARSDMRSAVPPTPGSLGAVGR